MTRTPFLRTSCLFLLAATLLAATPLARAQAPAQTSTEEIMTQAKTQAAAEHKNILVTFSASWCGPCHLFEHFLADPSIHPILDKSFVFTTLDVGEHPTDTRHADTPGAVAYRASLGGKDPGYPFIVMLDATGKPIVNSFLHAQRSDNIGYPALPDEVDWFMQTLKKADPTLSKDETKTIRNYLTAHGHN